MNERQDHRTYLMVGGIAAAYLFVVLLGCHLWPLDFIDCAHSFQSFHLVLFAPAGLSFTAVSLVLFHKTRESRKTAITYTGIVATVAVLMSFTMSQIASVTHDTAMLCLILIVVWISLSLTKSLSGALRSWAIVAAFLAAVMVALPDHQTLASLLYAMFSGGVALSTTRANKLAEYVGLAICVPFFILVCAILLGGLSRATSYADAVMIVTVGFFGLIPFVYLFTKNE